MTALAGLVRAARGSCLRGETGGEAERRASGGGGWGTCAGVRVAMYAVAAAAARRMGAGAIAGDLARRSSPRRRATRLGWDGSGAPAASSSPPPPPRCRASKTATTDGKKRKKGKGGAWGTAGAAEMEEYIASGGLIDRAGSRGRLCGGHGGGASRAACLEAVLTSAGAALKPSVRTLADAAAAGPSHGGAATAPPSRRFWRLRRRRSWRFGPPASLARVGAGAEAVRPTNLALAWRCSGAPRTFDRAGARRGRAMLCLEAVVHQRRALHPRAIAPPRLLYGGGGGRRRRRRRGDGTAASAGARGGESRGATGPRGATKGADEGRPRAQVDREGEEATG